MNLSIDCRCGTHFTIPRNQVDKIVSFTCPVYKRSLPTEHLEKIKTCMSLIDECHIVRPPKTSTTGVIDLGCELKIDFVE